MWTRKKAHGVFERCSGFACATLCVVCVLSYAGAVQFTSVDRYQWWITRGKFVLFSGPNDQPWSDFVQPVDYGWQLVKPWTFEHFRGWARSPSDVLYTSSIGSSGFGWATVNLWTVTALLGIPPVVGWVSRRRVRQPGCCEHCGYSRDGLSADAPCPECGENELESCVGRTRKQH